MTNNTPVFTSAKISLVFLLLSVFIFSFWLLGRMINVYHFPFVGAIFEILWLPIIVLTFILPVLLFLNWRKEKFILRSLNLYSIIIIISVILLAIFDV
jgi:hypothetical protein